MPGQQLFDKAMKAVMARYKPQYFPGFQLVLDGIPARVVQILEPDTLHYIIERHNPRDDTWDPVGNWEMDREETIAKARKAATRSRRTHRVIEALLPEEVVWHTRAPEGAEE